MSATKTPQQAKDGPTPRQRPPAADLLFDHTLASQADLLLDLERTRIAAENRLRQLTRDELDKDGVDRGFRLTDEHPAVLAQQAIIKGLLALEHQADLDLRRTMRRHPLGAWCKSAVGVGDRQLARLLGVIGDPYWNTLHNRPRTVSQLWAYCGLHTLPSGQSNPDTHAAHATGSELPADQRQRDAQGGHIGGALSSDPGHWKSDTQDPSARVAARRRKGVKCNWSTDAKMRAYLIATSCIKQANSPYRAVYLARRAHTAVTHPEWTLLHSHNDGLRIASKEILKDLWRAARDLHSQPANVFAKPTIGPPAGEHLAVAS